MKLIKKLSHWKMWAFTILPLILLCAWLGIIIAVYQKAPYNAKLMIGAQALLIIAILLMGGYGFFLLVKHKKYLRVIVSVVLMLCFLGLQIAIMVVLPNLIEISKEKENLYQIYKETSRDDVEYDERREAWRTANEKVNESLFTMQFLFYGSMFAVIICSFIYKKSDESDNNLNEDKDGSSKLS